MRLDPRQLARERRSLAVDLPLDTFPRFRDLVSATEGPIAVRVQFRRTEAGHIRIDGQLRVQLHMQCGNCSESGNFALETPVALCLVDSDDSARLLAGEEDTLVLNSVETTPAELFEDDLILALPDRPCHGRPGCPAGLAYAHQANTAAGLASRPGPFAVLASLQGADTETEQIRPSAATPGDCHGSTTEQEDKVASGHAPRS